MYVDLDPQDPEQREFRKRILAYCVYVDGHWIYTSDLRGGRILRTFKRVQYEVHHAICVIEGIGEIVCINPAHLADTGGVDLNES